ncbi:MAG: hypothetical protein ACTSSH_09005 [Candidatus Heimdallarchaeota archaeon]
MANRTAHVTVGLFIGAAYIPIDILLINKGENPFSVTWPFWVIALLLTILGSEGPDFDQLYGFMSHRDFLTHSAFYPGLFFGVCMWFKITTNHFLVTAFIPYLLAYGSHLFLDYFPNIDVRKLKDGKFRIKEKKGTFLIHFPYYFKTKEGKERKTLSVKKTEAWLLVNAFLCTAMALLLAFVKYYYPGTLPPMTI